MIDFGGTNMEILTCARTTGTSSGARIYSSDCSRRRAVGVLDA